MTIQRWQVTRNGVWYESEKGDTVLHAAHLAAMQRERECREKLVEVLHEATDAIIFHDERPPGTHTACGMEFPILFDKINAALAAAKEIE